MPTTKTFEYYLKIVENVPNYFIVTELETFSETLNIKEQYYVLWIPPDSLTRVTATLHPAVDRSHLKGI